MFRLPPRFLFVQVNKACNLKCGHCDFWQRKDDRADRYLSLGRLDEVIGEFSELNQNGSVVICGGEPMLDLDRYFGIAGLTSKHGLRSLSVVNGTRIRSAAMAERMIAEGPDEVSISLNSHRADLHDQTRGVAGAFDKAVGALRLLLQARAASEDAKTSIYVMGLVFSANYRDLESFYEFVLSDLGADKLKLNFLQPSFGRDHGVDPFFAQQGRIDPDELGAILERCDSRFSLGLNPRWREQAIMYAQTLNDAASLDGGWGASVRTRTHICNTYDRNIMLDHFGMARLCFAEAFRGSQIKRYGDLRQFWDTSLDIREEMTSCNRLCGISHSVRRETSTTASRSKTQVV